MSETLPENYSLDAFRRSIGRVPRALSDSIAQAAMELLDCEGVSSVGVARRDGGDKFVVIVSGLPVARALQKELPASIEGLDVVVEVATFRAASAD